MAKHLNNKVDEMSYDKLIAGMTPPVKVASGIIADTGATVEYLRGTVMAKSETTGKLFVLGTTGGDTLVPDCILCDAETVESGADVNAAVYVMGCFNIDALIVADSYTITEADKDKLRERGIYLGQLFD